MKKIISLALVLIMFLSIVACSQDSTPDAPVQDNQNQTTPTQDDPDDNDEPADAGEGAPVKHVDWYVDLSWMHTFWGEDMISSHIKETQGFDINIITPPAGGEAERMTTMVASGDIPDLITLFWGDAMVSEMISANLVLPLNELAEQYAPEFFVNADPSILEWNRQPDGNVYGFNSFTTTPNEVANDPNVFSNYSVLVRRDIYEAIGSPDMSTTEGFLDALRAAHEAFPEVEYGPLVTLGSQQFHTENHFEGSIGFASLLHDFLAIPREINGQINDRFTDPEYLRWMRMFRQATSEGLIPMDVFVDTGEEFNNKVETGRYFALLVQWVDITIYLANWYNDDPARAYMAIPGPRNINGSDPTLSAGSPNGWLTNMISATSGNEANAMQFMSYMASPEAIRYIFLGFEGVHYEVNADGSYRRTDAFVESLTNDWDLHNRTYGTNVWGFFNTSPASMQFIDDTTDAVRLARDIYKPYAAYAGAFSFRPFDADSPHLLQEMSTNTLWNATLPQLLLAPSDAAFDDVLQTFEEQRASLGFDDLQAARQVQLAENLEKIARFP
jgi:putative aldouronate transport system substrate-binding protein